MSSIYVAKALVLTSYTLPVEYLGWESPSIN